VLRTITNNRKILFWSLQITGWLGYALLNYLIGSEANEQSGDYIILSLTYAAGGVLITYGLRWLYRLAWDLRPLKILVLGGLGALIASALFTGYRSWAHVGFYGVYRWADLSLVDYFNLWDMTFSLYVMGTWSGLYFGIRYYRTVQDQRERLLRTTSMAHEAQLRMLRYQLNPHFLFNTLNAISTLVLEKDHDTANEMLKRLSAFLRHSLHSDPMQKVTLARELEALQMYLGIEQVRFEDRLRIEQEIEPRARGALVPGLLLQPLIENAIKHAIAVNEEGGTLRITATVQDGKLCLGVSDTGPGSTGSKPPAPSGPSGVGLENTRNRLSVLYGKRFELDMAPLQPAGLAVTIGIPFESSEQENHSRPHRR
jgi:signal transduction histidine kinase